MIFAVFLCDPNERFPQFDWQVWESLPWEGTAVPLGRRLGEWAWVGREPTQGIHGAYVGRA